MRRAVLLLLVAVLVLPLHAAELSAADKPQGAAVPPAVRPAPQPLEKSREVQAVKPRKPVRIKVHRNAQGQYSWDLSGDNPDDIYRADSRLKKLLKLEP